MIKQTKKVKMYYDEVIRLYQLGYSKSRICSILPISYPTILKWISIFDELNARIKALEAQLEKSEIRAIAYDRLIDIAEEKFNIPIRKKGDTKR